MSDVLQFTGTTKLPEEPKAILEKAKDWDLSRVLILGWGEDGEFAFGGSHSEVSENILMLEIARRKFLDAII